MKRTLQQSLLGFFPKKEKTLDGLSEKEESITTPPVEYNPDVPGPSTSTSSETGLGK